MTAYTLVKTFEQCRCDGDGEAGVDRGESHHPTVVYDKDVVAVSL